MMKHLLTLFLLVAPLSASAQAVLINPNFQVYGFLGCNSTNQVTFFDVKNAEPQNSLTGESCLEVLDVLAKYDVAVKTPLPIWFHPTLSDIAKEHLLFDVGGPGINFRTDSQATVICGKDEDGALKIEASDGFNDSSRPQPGASCVDALYALKSGGARVKPPVAARLRLQETGVQPASIVLLVILYSDPSFAADTPPKAQLICKADSGRLSVERLDQFGKYASVEQGESCAAARAKLKASGLVETTSLLPVEEGKTLLYRVVSRRSEGG